MHANGKNQISEKVFGKVPKSKYHFRKVKKGGDVMEKSKPLNELDKLLMIFEKVDPEKQQLVEKMVEHTAFLSDQLDQQKDMIKQVGMVKIHPTNPSLQKQTEVGKQYLKTLQAYSIAIKTLNSILTKNAVDEDDEYDRYLKSLENGDE